ncbi:MAG TPA: hypothetical protein VIY86_14920, partial [Pirellulaceae bacterium]
RPPACNSYKGYRNQGIVARSIHDEGAHRIWTLIRGKSAWIGPGGVARIPARGAAPVDHATLSLRAFYGSRFGAPIRRASRNGLLA